MSVTLCPGGAGEAWAGAAARTFPFPFPSLPSHCLRDREEHSHRDVVSTVRGGRMPPSLHCGGVSRPAGPKLSWLWVEGTWQGQGDGLLSKAAERWGGLWACVALSLCPMPAEGHPCPSPAPSLHTTERRWGEGGVTTPFSLSTPVKKSVSEVQPSAWAPPVPKKPLPPSAPAAGARLGRGGRGRPCTFFGVGEGLQSPEHTSKLERCADFPTPGSGGPESPNHQHSPRSTNCRPRAPGGTHSRQPWPPPLGSMALVTSAGSGRRCVVWRGLSPVR